MMRYWILIKVIFLTVRWKSMNWMYQSKNSIEKDDQIKWWFCSWTFCTRWQIQNNFVVSKYFFTHRIEILILFIVSDILFLDVLLFDDLLIDLFHKILSWRYLLSFSQNLILSNEIESMNSWSNLTLIRVKLQKLSNEFVNDSISLDDMRNFSFFSEF